MFLHQFLALLALLRLFAQVTNKSGHAAIALTHNEVFALHLHLVESVGCVFLAVESNLIPHVALLLRQVFQERQDVVKGAVLHVALPLGQDNSVCGVVRHNVRGEVEINDFGDGSAQITQILHVPSVLYNRGLTAQVTLNHLHLGVHSHSDFLNKIVFLVSEQDQFVLARKSLQKQTQPGSLQNLKADAQFVFAMDHSARHVDHKGLHGSVARRERGSGEKQTFDGRFGQQFDQVLVLVLAKVGHVQEGFVDSKGLFWLLFLHNRGKVVEEEGTREPDGVFE